MTEEPAKKIGNDDVDSDDGNMLNQLENGEIDFDGEDKQDQDDADKFFGLANSN